MNELDLIMCILFSFFGFFIGLHVHSKITQFILRYSAETGKSVPCRGRKYIVEDATEKESV